jgi:hypothetical protein
MMGFPCLRVNDAFFASFDRKNEGVVVKLPSGRVSALITAGMATPFAPAGRAFREWAAIPRAEAANWRVLLEESLAFVGSLGTAQPTRHRTSVSERPRKSAR